MKNNINPLMIVATLIGAVLVLFSPAAFAGCPPPPPVHVHVHANPPPVHVHTNPPPVHHK